MMGTVAFVLAVSAQVSAQEEVSALEDLVGLRGGPGMAAVAQRGYENVGGEKGGGGSYTYWREARTSKCVIVRVADGRVESIVYAPKSDCERIESGGGEGSASGADAEGTFETVCGVIVDGETYRDRCKVRNEGCEGEGHCRTILTYPDNELRLDWGKNHEVKVTIEGLEPVDATTTFESGQTRFEMDGKTYFFYRSQDRARKELAKFRQ